MLNLMKRIFCLLNIYVKAKKKVALKLFSWNLYYIFYKSEIAKLKNEILASLLSLVKFIES